ncbi:MAG: hypothetical protein Q8O33_09655 [Pseudomonadota bacterium]|nr:hypothetical protein [Pseudomonadota bacterium]
MFKKMSNSELRAFIDGCHASKDYGSDFEVACRVFNDRHDGVALTAEQFAALQRYAGHHGRCWKSQLLGDWTTGRDAERSDGSLLRQIRNTLGPAWLNAYRLPVAIA